MLLNQENTTFMLLNKEKTCYETKKKATTIIKNHQEFDVDKQAPSSAEITNQVCIIDLENRVCRNRVRVCKNVNQMCKNRHLWRNRLCRNLLGGENLKSIDLEEGT